MIDKKGANKIVVFASSFLDKPLTESNQNNILDLFKFLKGFKIDYRCSRDYRKKLSPNEFEDVFAVIADGEIYDEKILKKIGINGNGTVQFIVRYGVGYENIDLIAAKKYGILVTNCPGCNAIPTAEWTVAMILDVAGKKIKNHEIASKGLVKKTAFRLDIKGKTLGVIGLGNVGKELVKIMNSFGVNIIAYSSNKDKSFAKKYHIVYYKNPEEVYKNADIITIHTKTDNRLPLIKEKELKLMKPTTVLINCARSYFVDSKSVYNAVKNGNLFGYGLDDVWPHKNLPLKKVNIIVSPHMGSDTDYGKYMMKKMSVESIINFIKRRKLKYLLNK